MSAGSPQLFALAERLGERAALDAPLSRHSWLDVGGPADLLYVAQSRDDLVRAVRLAQEAAIRWRVFGGLTNLLLPDAGLRGLVVLNHARAVRFEPEHRLFAESGAIAVKVARAAVQRGWGGLTWAVGLPGTVGGAVVNNAGAFGGEIAGVLAQAEVLGPQGQTRAVAADWFDFEYRRSRLKGAHPRWLVLTATFQLRPGDPGHLAEKAAEYTQRRQRTQPPGKTLGSTFKNPPGDYAGRLIEAAGLKGARVGGFEVSEQHANFFMNIGGGSAADCRALIRQVQEAVWQRFGVRLEPEIEMLAEEPGTRESEQRSGK